MDVKIADRKEEIEFLRIACNMAELGISYIQADLILRLQERMKKKKGMFSMKDGAEIYYKWRQEWEQYAEQQKNKDT
jgi:hypothetical protein